MSYVVTHVLDKRNEGNQKGHSQGILSKLASSWVYKTKTWARLHSGNRVRSAQALTGPILQLLVSTLDSTLD